MNVMVALVKKDLKLFVGRRHFLFFAGLVFVSTILGLATGYADYQRRACRETFLKGEFEPLHVWTAAH